jgi:acetylornithine deacetylase
MTKHIRQLLQDLIAFKTISETPNQEIIDYLEYYLRPLGFDLMRIEHPSDKSRANLLASIGPMKDGGLMLSGHTDVVPVKGQDWQSDPFMLLEKEGRLYGRGTTDMKGFIASSLCALSRMSFKNLKKPLSLLWTCDEEVGCQGSRHAAPILAKYLPKKPEAALIGEPTDFAILRMHSGHVTVKLKVKGKGAHSSDPSLGISAIKALNQILTGIYRLEEELKDERSLSDFFKNPFVTLNVGQIDGGSAVNIIPDEARALIGFRPLPKASVKEIFERLKNRALESSQLVGARVSIDMEHCAPALFSPENTKLEKILRPFAQHPQRVAAAFTTDAGNLSEENISCLIFGPGSIDIAHQANEWVALSDLERASGIVKRVIADYLG